MFLYLTSNDHVLILLYLQLYAYQNLHELTLAHSPISISRATYKKFNPKLSSLHTNIPAVYLDIYIGMSEKDE